jgi:hypothetical protein
MDQINWPGSMSQTDSGMYAEQLMMVGDAHPTTNSDSDPEKIWICQMSFTRAL